MKIGGKGLKLIRRGEGEYEIPTCSMADIAFLLIIFFMLTTVFVTERGIRVMLPKAVMAKKLPKKNIAHIWISKEGAISINDKLVELDYVASIMNRKLKINPDLIVSIHMDKEGKYKTLASIFEQLKEAKTLKVSLATRKEKKGL
jgi:biopolymer transport protein ExbD